MRWTSRTIECGLNRDKFAGEVSSIEEGFLLVLVIVVVIDNGHEHEHEHDYE